MELGSAVAVVTGAGRGIGRAIALEYASHGAKVAVASRTAAQVHGVAGEIADAGGTALGIPTDVTDEASVSGMVDRVEDELGPIDILFNCAGAQNAIGPVQDCAPRDWLSDITVNLYGVFLCSHMVLPRMLERNRGYVINMIGGGTTSPVAHASAYGSSKAAVMRFTETMAEELAGTEVRVFAMSPGLVRTEMVRHIVESPAGQRWYAERVNAMLDQGMDVPPTFAAEMAVQLVSGRLDALVGRAVRADRDTAAELAQRADQIVANDERVLRMIAYPST